MRAPPEADEPVKVVRVRVFRQLQPFRRGTYAMGHVGSAGFDSTIVALDTDEGLTGWGEMAVISPAYADSFAAGAEAGIGDLAPLLPGLDPSQPRAVLTLLDGAMRGQPYVKSALDMACWDVTARAAGRPLCETLGARHGDAVPLYNVVTISSVDDAVALARELLADGYGRLQVKVGTTPEDDAERLAAVRDAVGGDVVLFADATMRDALVLGLTRFDFSGKTVIGGIVGGWIGVEIAKKWVGITTRTGDTYALALPLAIAVGRIGCHLNGCCYGSETDLAFGVDLHGAHRHAAPLYEAVLDVGVAAWVYATRAWPRPSGHLFRESVIGLALARVLTEFVRGDPAIALGPFTAAQVVSALFATGLIVHVVIERTRARATRTSATLS